MQDVEVARLGVASGCLPGALNIDLSSQRHGCRPASNTQSAKYNQRPLNRWFARKQLSEDLSWILSWLEFHYLMEKKGSSYGKLFTNYETKETKKERRLHENSQIKVSS